MFTIMINEWFQTQFKQTCPHYYLNREESKYMSIYIYSFTSLRVSFRQTYFLWRSCKIQNICTANDIIVRISLKKQIKGWKKQTLVAHLFRWVDLHPEPLGHKSSSSATWPRVDLNWFDLLFEQLTPSPPIDAYRPSNKTQSGGKNTGNYEY